MRSLTWRMKQGHWWIAGACIVSLGIGYLAGGRRAEPASAGQAAELSVNPRQASSSRDRQTRESSGDDLLAGILKGRSARDLSDAELAIIIRQLAKYDPSQNPVARARQSYQLQLLLAKLPASRLEQAAQAVANDPESKRSGTLNTLVAALAAKDPQRALAWAKEQTNASYLMASVIGTMAKDDPMAAADLYRAGLLDGSFGQHDGWSASYGIGTAMAKLGAKSLLSFIDSLPRQQQGNILSNACRELPETDRLAMMDEIAQRSKDGRLDEWTLKNMFSNTIASNPAQADAWLAKMEPGKQRATLEMSASNTLSQSGDPEAARAWMARAIADSPGKEKELLNEVVFQMAYSSPKDIAIFASLLPAGVELRADDLKSQASNFNYNGFSGLTGLAGAIRDPAEQAKLITGALDQFTATTGQSSQPARLNATDFEIFARQLATLNLSGDNAQQVQQALAAAKSARPKP